MVSSFVDIAGKMDAYLSGQSDLNSFREWIVRAQIEMENEEGQGKTDQDAARLLAEIEGRYAELSKELVSEEQWRRRLGELYQPQQASTKSLASTQFLVFQCHVEVSSKTEQLFAYPLVAQRA